MFYKTYNFFIHKNRMFLYFENKVKNVSDIVTIIIIIIIMIIIIVIISKLVKDNFILFDSIMFY